MQLLPASLRQNDGRVTFIHFANPIFAACDGHVAEQHNLFLNKSSADDGIGFRIGFFTNIH